MGHNTTIPAILSGIRVRVIRVKCEHHPVRARIAATVQAISVQKRELVQLLAPAFIGKGEPTVVAEDVRVPG